MSEAIGASIGSVGTAISAGPAVGASMGSSTLGEIGMSGIGFDSGSPSFSGLGRSDGGIGTFSVNEGPIGPVSFGNATDLISETKSFTASIGRTPERSVSGNIFGEDMTTIAKGANHTVEAKAQVHSNFDNLVPYSPSLPLGEGPVSFADFQSMFSAKEFIQTENNQESGSLSEKITASITAENIRTTDPLTAMQLESDLRVVDSILDLIDVVDSPETRARISNIAINIAVDRSGLVQALVKPEPETDPAAKAEAEPAQANVKAIVERLSPPEETKEPKQTQPRAQYFVDEDANTARQEETAQAIEQVFEEITPEEEKISGKLIVEKLTPEPPIEEISEIVLREGGRNDGSEAQRRNHLSLLEFETQEEALAANDRLILENNAVTDQEAAKRATEAEANKVRNGINKTSGEVLIFTLAA